MTGGAGFIGFNLAATLIKLGNEVVVLDNFNSYYDVRLKEARAHKLLAHGARVVNGDICDFKLLQKLFEEHGFTHVAHLAAQAGVRYSVNHPHDYIRSNGELTSCLFPCADSPVVESNCQQRAPPPLVAI